MADIKIYGQVVNGEGNPAIIGSAVGVNAAPGNAATNGSWYTLNEAISYIYANIGAINDDLKNINSILDNKTLVTL